MLGRACPVVTRGITPIFGLSEPGGQSLGLVVRTPWSLCELLGVEGLLTELGYTKATLGHSMATAWLPAT